MTPIREVFGVPVALLPVVHILDETQGVSEATLAFRAGAPGVFLIQHDGDTETTLRTAITLRPVLNAEGFANPWVGVNLLGYDPARVFYGVDIACPDDVQGVWCDCGPRGFEYRREPNGRLWFGGVAFKYQTPTLDMDVEIRESLDAGVDVLTTSGPATGVPCDPEKVRRLRDWAREDRSVGVASGVSVVNARELILAGADALLVATSICKRGDFYHIDPGRLRELLAEVRGSTP